MYTGNFVFSQLMAHLPMHIFRRCVRRYQGNRYVKSFKSIPLSGFCPIHPPRELGDIEVCLRHRDKLYHMGLRGGMARNTLAHANKRDWRLYADFAHALIRLARPLYVDDDLGLELDKVYALVVHHRRLSVFPSHFRHTKGR